MSTGYDDGGSTRLVCVGPPDATPDSVISDPSTPSPPGSLIPNVFYGGGEHAYNAVSQATVGVNDVSLELWFKPVRPSNQDQGWRISLSDVGSPSTERFLVYTNPGATSAHAEYQPGGTANYFTIAPKWSYLVARWDRDLQVEIWIDGVQEHQAALADAAGPTNWGALEFYPPFVSTPSALADDENLNWAVGPLALHTGLLTAAQQLSSMRRRGIQLLGATLAAYDWRGVTGHTGWEFSIDSLEIGIRDTFEQSYHEPGCPTGADGTVVIPDISGNGRDVTLSTLATYPAVAAFQADRGRCAFSRDIFFR